eukprot:5961614-Pyramimonas_sp.AAC.1
MVRFVSSPLLLRGLSRSRGRPRLPCDVLAGVWSEHCRQLLPALCCRHLRADACHPCRALALGGAVQHLVALQVARALVLHQLDRVGRRRG